MADQKSILGEDFLPDSSPNSDEKTIAALSHILTFAAPVLAPLIIYVIKKNESAFVAKHAKESLNFQLTLMILFISFAILMMVLVGFFLVWALGVFSVILIIVATIRASEGRIYRYPFNIRFIQ